MSLSEGQMRDHKGAALMLNAQPPARGLVGSKDHNSDRFRQALCARGIAPHIPSRRGRKQRIPHDRAPYRQRHRIENMFRKLMDWRRIAMRCDRCPHTPMSAVCLAAPVLF
jgi:transposase